MLAVELCVGRGGHVLDACGPLCEYEDALKILAALMGSFEELCGAHWAVQVGSDA